MHLIQILASEYCHLTAIGLYSWKPNPNVRSVGKKGIPRTYLKIPEMSSQLVSCVAKLKDDNFRHF